MLGEPQNRSGGKRQRGAPHPTPPVPFWRFSIRTQRNTAAAVPKCKPHTDTETAPLAPRGGFLILRGFIRKITGQNWEVPYGKRTYPLQLALQPSSNSSCLRTLRVKQIYIKMRGKKGDGGRKRRLLRGTLYERANAIPPGFTRLPQRGASPQG